MAQSRGLKRIQQPRNAIQFVVDPATRAELKPIVFFDAGKFTKDNDGLHIGSHPHSGIGILTYFHGTDLHHKDSGRNDGIIYDGGAQWICAGGGVWHSESYRRKHDAPGGSWTGSIHQLWLQLPPDYEEAEVDYANVRKEEIPSVGNVKVLTGSYKGLRGAMNIPISMTYLDVSLSAHEAWSFETPAGQTSGFVFTRDGSLAILGSEVGNGQMGILEANGGTIGIRASAAACNFVLVLAEPSPWPIVASGGQIHTSREALARSTARIRSLAASR